MQTQKSINKFIIFIFFTNLFFVKAFTLFNINPFNEKTGKVDFVFQTDIQARKTQVIEFEKILENFKKRIDDSNKNLNKNINLINTELANIKEKFKKSSYKELALYNKKTALLNDRKQNLKRTQELWKETRDLLEKHISLIKDIIEKQEETLAPETIKLVYSWKEYKEAQENITTISAKIDQEKEKKDNFKKQKLTEKETLLSLQKQLETKRSEKTKDSSILEQELNLLNEKIAYSNLKIENIDIELKYKDDEISLYQYQLNQTENFLNQIEKRLSIDSSDTNVAKIEYENEEQKVAKIKTQLLNQKDIKKNERENIAIELEKAKENLKQIKNEKEEIFKLETEAKYLKIESQFSLLNKEIQLIDIKTDKEELSAKIKRQQYEIIDSYNKLNLQKDSIDFFIVNFKTQKELISSEIKTLTEKLKTENAYLLEINRNLDALKIKKEDISNKKETLIDQNAKIYSDIINNINDTQKNLYMQQQLTQEYLALISDLLTQSEKVLNQFDFVIKNFESKKTALSIWKRSPKAISWDNFIKSIDDAEKFFKDLFWQTPKNLGPANLYLTIKLFIQNNYANLILFFILFIILFFVIKKSLDLLKKYISAKYSLPTNSKNHLYFYTVFNAILEYTLNNYTLLFSLIYTYIFYIKLLPAKEFFISLFFLISIPLCLYLSFNFILTLKILNKKLSYLFFAEKFQSKSIFLVSSILYSTSILIPLKEAYLVYNPNIPEFSSVILAAYTLILVISILLFFGKEDILTIIPATNQFFLWLKNKIDIYYYPVFIFFMGLFILVNPYIGYSNLAWYLAFAVPASFFLIYGIFLLHHYIRKTTVSFFIKEENDEILNKFEHAKTYYGFFIVAVFLVLSFFAFIFVARIWGFDYTIHSAWKTITQDWVLPLGTLGNKEIKLGLMQLMTLTLFIVIGFLVSSFSQKFILKKLFDIFRTEPGTQNTISKITHYIIISLSILLGFVFINLEQFFFWVGGFLIFGIGFGLKDLVTDFVAGFFVLIERPIEIGSYVQIDEKTEGTVRKISARSTTIRTGKNSSIIVPNKDLISKPLVNLGQGSLAIGFEIRIIVSYKSNADLVKKLLLQAINAHPLILKVPAPIIRLEDITSDGLHFFTRAFISSRRVREQWDIASDLRLEILKLFSENGVKMPVQQRIIKVEHAQSSGNPEQKNQKPIDIKFDKN